MNIFNNLSQIQSSMIKLKNIFFWIFTDLLWPMQCLNQPSKVGCTESFTILNELTNSWSENLYIELINDYNAFTHITYWDNKKPLLFLQFPWWSPTFDCVWPCEWTLSMSRRDGVKKTDGREWCINNFVVFHKIVLLFYSVGKNKSLNLEGFFIINVICIVLSVNAFTYPHNGCLCSIKAVVVIYSLLLWCGKAEDHLCPSVRFILLLSLAEIIPFFLFIIPGHTTEVNVLLRQ